MSRTAERARKPALISLRESYAAQPGSLRVDREKGIIYGVKVLGRFSGNNHPGTGSTDGTEYTEQAMRGALPLYEGQKVNCDHPDRRNPDKDRSVYDRVGKLRDAEVRFGSGDRQKDGVFANLHLIKSHPMAGPLLDAAESRDLDDCFGMSHNASGVGALRESKYVIHEIPVVRSVDVVADAGTVVGLFESKDTRMAGKNAKKPLTLRKVMEALKVPGARLTQLWEMEGGLLKPDLAPDEQPAPEPDAPPDANTAIAQAIIAILQDDGLTPEQKQKKVLQATDLLLGAEPPAQAAPAPIADAVEGDDEEEADPAGDAGDGKDPPPPKKDKQAMESRLRELERKDQVRDLCESEQFQPSKTQLKALVLLESDADRKALIAELKGAPGRKPAVAPRSGPAGGRPTPTLESAAPKDAKEFATALFS
jgi:hypothetical protein